MNADDQKKLHKELQEYLIANPIERGQGCYGPVAEKFKVNTEYVRDVYRKLRKAGKVEMGEEVRNYDEKFVENLKQGTGDLAVVTESQIKTLEDLIKVCKIDTEVWNIDSWECNKWEVGRRAKTHDITWTKGVMDGKGSDKGTVFVQPLFQVKAKLSRRKLDTDLQKQKELIINEIKEYTKPKALVSAEMMMFNAADPKDLCAFEINIPDLHVGKLAWKDETGEHYDLKIAVERYKNAVKELLSRAPVDSIDRFVLVIGNDMLNVDGKHNLTTNGTPQSSDGRFYKMVQVAKKLLIETIDGLSFNAAVDVIVVPGNHDNNSMLMLGDVLDAWYHNNSRVKVFNEPTQRKYYQYGSNGFMYTHGNEEKHSELGMIFAAEKPYLWADTRFRICKIGHFHKNKRIEYVSVDEFQGFQVQILPSLSGSDAWHASKGYNSLKQAKGFLYHKDKGQIAEYTYTV